jgi:hypothetical protein
MMSNTPRVFVGTTTFLVEGMTSRSDLQTVTAVLTGFAGGRVVNCQLDGLVAVTTERPVNRADLTAAIIRAGYPVLA